MRAGLILAVALAALIAAGPQAIGRLFLWGQMPGLAALFLSDPVERGLALYRAGDYARADAAFAKAGRSQTYNRGLSLAAVGEYPLSVAYFDAVLFANPADAEALHNRDLVARMYPPTQGVSIVPGRISGAGGLGAGAATAQSSAGIQDPETQRPIDAKGLVASEDWLATLSDDPGEFLRLRLRAEYERRAEQGLIRPREAVPW